MCCFTPPPAAISSCGELATAPEKVSRKMKKRREREEDRKRREQCRKRERTFEESRERE
jgi:hypothetical protein